MKRATALLSMWYLAVGGVVAAVTAAAPPDGSHDVIFLLIAAQFVGVMILARRFRTVSSRVVLLAGLIAGLCTAQHLIVGDDAWYTSALALGLGIAEALLLLLLLASLRRRNGQPLDRAMTADIAIVALCGWIAGWSLLVQEVNQLQGGRDVATVLFAISQPISLVTLFVSAALIAGRRVRVPALWMVVAAAVSATAADLVASTIASGHLAQAERWMLPLHIFAVFAGGAAMLHPSVTELRRPPGTQRHDMTMRITGVSLSLVLAVVVLAATSPDDTLDLIVRTFSTIALAGVVTMRVMAAARANHRAQAALLHGAQTDPLTGLANRGVLLERINDLLRTSWGPEVQPTLFFVDLDRFKNINDSLGHAAGDEVLIKVAKRLVDTVPESATVARMSGDEYVVLDPASRSQGASMALAERMLAVFREPLQLSQGDVFVTASIGVAAISATTTTSPEDLVRHADTAMYRAKDAGRNCVAVYDESMHERVAHRLAVETALYRALDRRELRLFHQPILDLNSGEVVGFEALMRWQQTDGTIVSPGEFIPIAEDTGTIVPIGSWALLEALSTLRSWIDDGVCSPTATMSVNVSPRQLGDSNFPAIVSEALTRSGVSPQLLWLEVTESVMITEPELALATLRRLRSLGVRVAMDDFGTGYSSLSLLQKFPLQRIKIDRAFVHGVADNPNDRSLVRTIVAMGRSLGLDMVAEGVESVHQLQVLSDLGCTKAQGFLISHPVPPDAMRSTVAALERLGQFPGLRPNIAVPAN